MGTWNSTIDNDNNELSNDQLSSNSQAQIDKLVCECKCISNQSGGGWPGGGSGGGSWPGGGGSGGGWPGGGGGGGGGRGGWSATVTNEPSLDHK